MVQPGVSSTVDGRPGGASAGGPPSDADPLVKRLWTRRGMAVSRRQVYESTWEEIYDFCMPNRMGFRGGSMEGQARKSADIFDETAVIGVEEFANRMQDGLMPSQRDWALFRPSAGNEELTQSDQQEEQKILDRAQRIVFEMLRESNFYSVVSESLRDLAVGHATLRFDDTTTGFRFQAVPQQSYYWLNDSGGNITDVFQARTMSLVEIAETYGAEKLTEDDRRSLGSDSAMKSERPTTLAVVKNQGTGTQTYSYLCFDGKTGRRLMSAQLVGEGSSPMIPFRWALSPGEIYGRGPLFNALPAIRVLNLTKQLLLENADTQIGGVWKMEDDGVVNIDTLQIQAGRVYGYAGGTKGLEPMTPAGRFDMSQLIVAEMRHDIQKALYNETLGPRQGTPPSATEVAERMADLSRRMGSVLDRLQLELLRPVLVRAVYLLRKRGLQLPERGGQPAKFQFLSPLIRQREADDIQRFARFSEQVAQQYGPQLLKSMVKEEDAVRWLAEKWGVPASLIRNSAEVATLAKKMAQQAVQAGAAGGGGDGIGIPDLGALTGPLAGRA